MSYFAYKLACFAVFLALKKLRPYRLYEKSVVHIDHVALYWLLTIDDPIGHHMR